jgi:hypothetical protein
MQLMANSSEINVGDIISEHGVISDMWDENYDDDGTEYNEFSRFIVLERIHKDETPMIVTGANEYYFKVQMIYVIPPIAALYNRTHDVRATVTDYEIDEEDFDGSMGDNSPRKWYKCS